VPTVSFPEPPVSRPPPSPRAALVHPIGRIAGLGLLVAVGVTQVRATADEPLVLFRQATDGVHTFRIPGVVVTSRGTVLVWCEARRLRAADRGEIEIHIRRSTDGGRTFSPPRQVAHRGPRLPRNPHLPAGKIGKDLGGPDEQTVNNAVGVALRDGRVLLVYCVEYARVFVITSDDDGVTWSVPVEITTAAATLRPRIDWQAVATGPGHGIETSAGRVVVPLWLADYGFVKGDRTVAKGAATIVSDDRGATWQGGELAIPGGNEAAVVELSSGRVLLTARNTDPRNRRLAATSPDGARDWSVPFFIDDLPEWGCSAGLVRHPGTARHPGPWLLHSAPDTVRRVHRARRDVSLWISRDDGATWPTRRLLRAGPSAYSDLAVLPDGTILCVLETGLPGVGQQDGSDRPWAYAAIAIVRADLDEFLATPPAR